MSEQRNAFFFARFPYVVNYCGKKCIGFCDNAQKIAQIILQKVKCQVQMSIWRGISYRTHYLTCFECSIFCSKKIAIFSARNTARNNATNIAMRLSDLIPRPLDAILCFFCAKHLQAPIPSAGAD